jgi:signal transduction histidine kinase
MLKIESQDEIGDLASSFNEMAGNLQKTTTSIDNLNREIAERKKVEETLRVSRSELSQQNDFLNNILESLTHPFYVVDANDYTVKMANSAARAGDLNKDLKCYALAYDRNQPCTGDGHICPLAEIKRTKKPVTVEHIHPDKDGYPRNLEIHGYPIFDRSGNVCEMIEYYFDITDRKEAEARQTQLLSEVEKVNNELKDFAYVVSHDLKAPLRGINNLVDWISTDYADKLDQEGKDQMALLSRRAQRMHDLIEGILQYSRVGRIQEEKVQVNLNELINEIIDMIAVPENITISVENELPVIEFEKTRIIQLFQNLLSNAVKYMDKPQGKIEIDCVEEDGFWKFSVADNGPGIEEKHFDKIFQLFQTLSPQDEYESTGVGLTLVKKIIEMYGGRIWVDSKVGLGSVFLFTIPKLKKEAQDAKLEANIAC